MSKDTEACGRCSMTVVVDAVDEETEERDPFGEERIEVDEREMERVSPEAWISRVSSKIDSTVSRFAWNR